MIINNSLWGYIRTVKNEQVRRLRNLFHTGQNLRFLNKALGDQDPPRPVFIIGPPRCGSTLFYQALTSYFRFCFFTNAMMETPFQIPETISRKHLELDHVSDFQSNYGKTAGRNAPHEGWPFWRRFYPRREHDYVCKQPLRLNQVREIQKTILYLEKFYQKPFLSKNIETVLRLRSLQDVFPEAIFLVLKRDPRATAASILTGREKLYGDRKYWLGMRPKDYAKTICEEPVIQVVRQILAAYETFYLDCPSGRFLEIYYEDFCHSPAEHMRRIGDFLQSMGVIIETSGNSLPDHFPLKKHIELTDREMSAITNILSKNYVFQRHLSFRVGRF